MSLLELALNFIQAYCEKHMTCVGCRMYRNEVCRMQMIHVPPMDWDIEDMVKGVKRK